VQQRAALSQTHDTNVIFGADRKGWCINARKRELSDKILSSVSEKGKEKRESETDLGGGAYGMPDLSGRLYDTEDTGGRGICGDG